MHHVRAFGGRYTDAPLDVSFKSLLKREGAGVQEDVFLTGKRGDGDGDTASLPHATSPGVHITRGRPDLASLLSSAARTAAAVGESRVAIMVCGNQGIVEKVLAAAREASTADVALDCHHEKFSF